MYLEEYFEIKSYVGQFDKRTRNLNYDERVIKEALKDGVLALRTIAFSLWRMNNALRVLSWTFVWISNGYAHMKNIL